ncbi:hypothetical protein [Leeuwenhoekiella sp. CH_XMU1409-2]|uniref:hypothetical protein n=1 Tax=Leeuwenhoekiella sp. CH_XMU1409-2 TaxID=3107768 RepID=UPI00300B712C
METKTTDLDNFKKTYKSFGIDFGTISNDDQNTIVVELAAGDHPKLKGYTGFHTKVIFDKNGKFLEQIFQE